MPVILNPSNRKETQEHIVLIGVAHPRCKTSDLEKFPALLSSGEIKDIVDGRNINVPVYLEHDPGQSVGTTGFWFRAKSKHLAVIAFIDPKSPNYPGLLDKLQRYPCSFSMGMDHYLDDKGNVAGRYIQEVSVVQNPALGKTQIKMHGDHGVDLSDSLSTIQSKFSEEFFNAAMEAEQTQAAAATPTESTPMESTPAASEPVANETAAKEPSESQGQDPMTTALEEAQQVMGQEALAKLLAEKTKETRKSQAESLKSAKELAKGTAFAAMLEKGDKLSVDLATDLTKIKTNVLKSHSMVTTAANAGTATPKRPLNELGSSDLLPSKKQDSTIRGKAPLDLTSLIRSGYGAGPIKVPAHLQQKQ